MTQFKFTEQDNKLFSSLHGTQQGVLLIDYLERVNQHLSDIRNLKEINDVEIKAVRKTVDTISEMVIQRIKLVNKPADKQEDYY